MEDQGETADGSWFDDQGEMGDGGSLEEQPGDNSSLEDQGATGAGNGGNIEDRTIEDPPLPPDNNDSITADDAPEHQVNAQVLITPTSSYWQLLLMHILCLSTTISPAQMHNLVPNSTVRDNLNLRLTIYANSAVFFRSMHLRNVSSEIN